MICKARVSTLVPVCGPWLCCCYYCWLLFSHVCNMQTGFPVLFTLRAGFFMFFWFCIFVFCCFAGTRILLFHHAQIFWLLCCLLVCLLLPCMQDADRISRFFYVQIFCCSSFCLCIFPFVVLPTRGQAGFSTLLSPPVRMRLRAPACLFAYCCHDRM